MSAQTLDARALAIVAGAVFVFATHRVFQIVAFDASCTGPVVALAVALGHLGAALARELHLAVLARFAGSAAGVAAALRDVLVA